MKKYYYSLKFSPYINIVYAKNKKDAWARLRKIWSEYNINDLITLV